MVPSHFDAVPTGRPQSSARSAGRDETPLPSPLILSTWSFGRQANAAGWPVLAAGGSSLDAVEAACRVVEADPAVDSVGRGGLPDAAGEVSLDGCVMLSPRQCAGVCAVRAYNHPVSIARQVMERTPHVLVAGHGAEAFADQLGYGREELLTLEARKQWERWRHDRETLHADPRFQGWLPPRNIEEMKGYERERNASETPSTLPDSSHDRPSDTVGVLAIDARGVMAGACSTSGMAFKVPGRVGDSPIIGHGLYVLPGVGAAVGTGNGELIMSVCGAFLAVEEMRRGATPAAAALAVIERIAAEHEVREEHQAVMLVMDARGNWSAAALRPGYRTAVTGLGFRETLMAPSSIVLFPEERR